ncbi:hypothetical protein LCGC14_2499750 [marine sediment metagenome]|uniref:Uncharacterized protein n=1 Tax=marine sediment metagenome TaxID=412755 RepID=A0A0F9BQA5_9ZZZZ
MLVQAVNHALMVLSWFENLPKDDVPPRNLWWSGDMLDDWFEEVERRRKKKSSGKKSTYEAADEVPSMGNQLVDDEQRIPR